MFCRHQSDSDNGTQEGRQKGESPLGAKFIDNALNVVKTSGAFTENILLALNAVFGPTFIDALELLDKRSINEIISQTSNRRLYQVRGTSGINYIILPNTWRCSCPAFVQKTMLSNESITCKHILATKLIEVFEQASSTDTENPYVKRQNISEETYIQMVAHMD